MNSKLQARHNYVTVVNSATCIYLPSLKHIFLKYSLMIITSVHPCPPSNYECPNTLIQSTFHYGNLYHTCKNLFGDLTIIVLQHLLNKTIATTTRHPAWCLSMCHGFLANSRLAHFQVVHFQPATPVVRQFFRSHSISPRTSCNAQSGLDGARSAAAASGSRSPRVYIATAPLIGWEGLEIALGPR